MNAHDPTVPGHSRPHSRSWGRFAGIVAFYGLLGPLIGAVGVNGLFTLMTIGSEIVKGNFGDIARLLVGGMVVGTIVSLIIAYAVGIVSAVAVGLVVAFRDRREGGVCWRAAVIAALVAWLLTLIATITAVPPAGLAQWAGALLIGHLLAAAVCTWIARRVFR